MEWLQRWWRQFDWNWRAFGWQEWFCLLALPFWLTYLVMGATRRDWNNAAVGALETPLTVYLFLQGNRQRQNPTRRRPEREQLDPADRPLRLALGFGFVVLLALFGLILWASPR